MEINELTPEEIESGEYYRRGRLWYSELFHRPISQRSYYLVVITLSLINLFFAALSFSEIFPIHQRVPFIVYSNDVWEELPVTKALNPGKSRNENQAVMEFLLASYMEARESYDQAHYDLRYRSVWTQSTPEVFERYKAELTDASSIYSPYHLYSNHSKRVVRPLSIEFPPEEKGKHASIKFLATVISTADNQEENVSKWQADIIFDYTPFAIDQSLEVKHWWIAHAVCKLGKVFCLTGDTPATSDGKPKVIPMTFLVSDYQVKRLLE